MNTLLPTRYSKTHSCRFGVVLAFVLGLTAAPGVRAGCKPDFPYRMEWMGADAAYSTRISPGKTFWSFGDTYYGRTGLARQAMTRNSVAISTCRNGKFVIRYARKVDPASGRQVDFFESPGDREWYWPKGSLLYKNKLYVFLGRMVRTESPVFPFALQGTDLAIVNNPRANPLDWDIEYRTFIENPEIHAAAAVVKAGKYAYVYSTVDSINGLIQPVVLYRIPLEKLSDAGNHVEYLTNSRANIWKKGVGFGDARIILEKGTTEFSVHWDPGAVAWRLIVIGRAFVDDKAIYTSLSNSLTQPWERLEYIKFIDDAEGQVCYAAKRIEGYNGFLYNCQWNDRSRRLSDLSVHRPVVIPFQTS